jgi:hypothetical protein
MYLLHRSTCIFFLYRVCVALSRAQHGLYILGSMEGLSLSSPFWSQVQDRLEAAGSLVSAFQLACEAHQRLIPVACAAEFQNLKARTLSLFVFLG